MAVEIILEQAKLGIGDLFFRSANDSSIAMRKFYALFSLKVGGKLSKDGFTVSVDAVCKRVLAQCHATYRTVAEFIFRVTEVR